MALISSKEYPLLKNGLIYLDSSALAPMHEVVVNAVIDAMHNSAPISRGLYDASENATTLYENSRREVAQFINALPAEISFSTNSTQIINNLARSLAEKLTKDDEIIITEFEHHSNLVIWQEIAFEKKCKLKFIKAEFINGIARFDLKQYESLLSKKTKIVSFTAISNVIGAIEPINKIAEMAHAYNAFVIVDAAQYLAHYKTDVKNIKADAIVFSGHKIGALPGTAFLYINENKIDFLRPAVFGGGMVFAVDIKKTLLIDNIRKFEAGTPAFVNIISLQAAIKSFKEKIDFELLHQHELMLSKRLQNGLISLKAKIYSDPQAHLVTFSLDKHHPHDIAAWCNNFNIAIRAGDHCAQPLHKILNINGTIRASFGAYNKYEDIDLFLDSIESLKSLKN